MPLRLRLEGVEDLTPLLAITDPKLYDKVVRAGLKYAARAAKTSLAKEVRANFNISSARVKEDIKGPFINTQDGYIDFRFEQRPPTAIAYGATGGPRRLRSGYVRGKPKRVIPRGFIAKGLPFVRSESTGKLKVRHGPSLARIVLGRGSLFSQQIIRETTQRSFDQWGKGVERAFAGEARRRARRP